MPNLATPTGIRLSPITVVERYASGFTVTPLGCWEWHKVYDSGYGHFTVNGRTRVAHRIMWELIGRPVVPELQLDHLCRNRACVNPNHLEQVTSRVNTLRGETLTAANFVKTHCMRGHEFTPENTYTHKGGRQCKICTIEGIYKRRGSTKKLTKCIGRLSHYEVIAPEIVTYESIVTYQDGPPEAWRCWGEFLAQNAQEAIKMALKHEDFKEWVAEARADGLNPYQGVEAKRFKCEHGICLGCNEECETCNAALEEVYK